LVGEDLSLAGGGVSIRGLVRDDVRAAGGEVDVFARIDGDLVVTGGSVTIHPEAIIKGDIIASGGDLKLLADHPGNVKMSGGDITLNARIDGDVELAVGSLDVGDDLKILGNVKYRSKQQFPELEERTVGRVDYMKMPSERHAALAGLGAFGAFLSYLFGRILWLVLLILVALLIVNIMPNVSRDIIRTIEEKPWHSIGYGALIFFGAPVLLLILLVTIIGIPLALIGGAAYAFMLMFAKVFTILFIGSYVLSGKKKSGKRSSKTKKKGASPSFKLYTERLNEPLMVGMLIYLGILLIPVIGKAVGFVATLFGLGAVFMVKIQKFHEMRKKKIL
ncbi:MAG: hypothetical protein ACOC32_04225, partial [Nanoarchaeota archaeon]